MAAPRPTGSIDIWNFVDNITGTTVRKWIRDSWARRKIVALQQAVAAIVVPTKTSQLTNDSGYITQADVPPGSTPSSTTPLMDGTAAVGTENAFARGDHRHPTDTTRQAALSTTQMAAVNSGVTAAKVQAWDGITVPTKTSDLTNDSNFQTGTEVGNAISAEAGLMIPYGYCTTAAGTVAKTVTVSPAVTELTTGLTITVKFQYANTGSNPTLNVNGLGAKAIKRYGTTAAGTSAAANWNANSVVMLTYDGTYWMLVDWNNTTYSGMSDAEYQAGTSTTNRLITPARLKAAIELHAPVQSVNGQDGDVTIAVPTKTSELTNDSGFLTSAPVTSVNGQTGAVTVNVPTKTSDLTNDSGYITSAPVQSVNGQTGAVSLDASDVGALPDTTVIPSKTSDLTNDSGYITASAIPSVPSASTTNPKMDGTASAGSSGAWSRGDHVHPHDTTKQDSLTSAQLAAVNSGITSDDLAVNDSSVLCPVTPIVPTLDAGTHHATYGGCWYYKIGHHVCVHIGVASITANTATTLWQMPAGYIPYSGIAVNGQGSGYNNVSRARVTGTGAVIVNSTQAYATVYLEYDAFS